METAVITPSIVLGTGPLADHRPGQKLPLAAMTLDWQMYAATQSLLCSRSPSTNV